MVTDFITFLKFGIFLEIIFDWLWCCTKVEIYMGLGSYFIKRSKSEHFFILKD